MITAAKIRFSEQKTKFYLSFLEREYLRGKASEIRFFPEQSTFFLQKLCIVSQGHKVLALTTEAQGLLLFLRERDEVRVDVKNKERLEIISLLCSGKSKEETRRPGTSGTH